MKLNKKHIKNLSKDKSALPSEQTINVAGGRCSIGSVCTVVPTSPSICPTCVPVQYTHEASCNCPPC